MIDRWLAPGGFAVMAVVMRLAGGEGGGEGDIVPRATAPPDQVVVSTGGTGSLDGVMLLDGVKRAFFPSFVRCVNDERWLATGTVPVTVPVGDFMQFSRFWYGCRPELALFSVGHAMVLDPAPGFTSKPNDQVIETLGPRLIVDLNVWVPQGHRWAASWAGTDVDDATSLSDANRVGIEFQPVGGTAMHYTPSQGAIIGDGCDHVGSLIATGPPLYDPAKINVYYVDEVSVSGWDEWAGFDCYEWDATNVIYISLLTSIWNTLTHELGHALGLQYQVGHTDLTPRNLMQAYLDLKASEERDHLSLGQAYRMNVDARSWVNRIVRVGSGASAIRQGVVKACQPYPDVAKPCPRLACDLGGGCWP